MHIAGQLQRSPLSLSMTLQATVGVEMVILETSTVALKQSRMDGFTRSVMYLGPLTSWKSPLLGWSYLLLASMGVDIRSMHEDMHFCPHTGWNDWGHVAVPCTLDIPPLGKYPMERSRYAYMSLLRPKITCTCEVITWRCSLLQAINTVAPTQS